MLFRPNAFFRETKFRAEWWWKLKQLGYDPIPLRYGKDSPYKGWPKMPNGESDIAHWYGAGAAIRKRGSELLSIDLDVHAESARDAMLDWMTSNHPEVMKGCLRRHSGAVTLMLIGRTVTAKGTSQTAYYIGEGTAPKGDRVEIFTGNSKRYIGVAGAHSHNRTYDYFGPHITEVPVDRLPWLADCELAPMVAAFERIMAEHGWEKVIPVIGRAAIGTKVYDLEPDMIFKLADETEIALIELEEWAQSGIGLGDFQNQQPLKGYATLWDPSTGGGKFSNTRVLVTYGSEGLCLYDTKYEVRHRWKSAAPTPGGTVEKLRKILKSLHDKHQAEVRS